MSMMSKRKGKTGEQEVCRLLRESLGDIGMFIRNSMQAHGVSQSGTQADILTNLPLAPEVKRTEDFNPRKWLLQARSQATGDRLPVVIHRANGEPWRFLFELNGAEFCRVVRAVHMFNKLPKETQAKLLSWSPQDGGALQLPNGGNDATD